MSEGLPASKRRRRPSWLAPVWLVPLITAAGLGYFVDREVNKSGPKIEISFVNADGIEPRNSDLKYRGVKVGEVRSIDMSSSLKRVIVGVELERSAAGLAREGSRFWIVRPSVSASGIRGLTAVLGGAYIEVLPGRGEEHDRFEGLEEALAVEGRLRALQVYLISDLQTAFESGAPVYYGAIKVGAVADSELSPDSSSVRSRVMIERPYEALVRANSRFWNAGGVRMHLGLKGLDLKAKSFTSLVAGGIAFATPDPPGPPAQGDAEFPLADKAKDAWLKWRPKIKLSAQPPESER